jgi:hypothetical protein
VPNGQSKNFLTKWKVMKNWSKVGRNQSQQPLKWHPYKHDFTIRIDFSKGYEMLQLFVQSSNINSLN